MWGQLYYCTEFYLFQTKVKNFNIKGILLTIFAAAMNLFLKPTLGFQALRRTGKNVMTQVSVERTKVDVRQGDVKKNSAATLINEQFPK